MKYFVIILILIVLGGIFLFFGDSDSVEPTDEATSTQPADGVEPPMVVRTGVLEDVTDGAVVRGVTTLPTTSGTVQAGFAGETFIVNAEFLDLPDPRGDDFYEGWVVRRGDNMSVVSTGKLTKEDEQTYTNVFTSDIDLFDHDLYVLTLEPNDGDPAPADHILEGELEEI